MPKSKEDLLTLLEATLYSSQRLGKPIITMSMGKLGRLSRMMNFCLEFSYFSKVFLMGMLISKELKIEFWNQLAY